MSFSQNLERWYADFGRVLPWRGIEDPYKIWLSEIILQQTRIEQGRDYYLRFVETFPTVADLTAASEEQVLRLWQGLGYYSRARNMHAAARYIVEELDGKFPDTYEGLLKLKGVGRYTAAAIASFAFRLPYPVIDGNVYRFISRMYGIATPIATDAAYTEFEGILKRVMDMRRPDTFNAALMDFGSLQCRPLNPDCGACPFADTCVAHTQDKVAFFPVKAPKTKPMERYFYYVHLSWNQGDSDATVMHQRQGNDIWMGLYEFPLIETTKALPKDKVLSEVNQFIRKTFGLKSKICTISEAYSHQLTHRTIRAWFVKAELAQEPNIIPPEYRLLQSSEVKNVPVSRLIDKYLHKL